MYVSEVSHCLGDSFRAADCYPAFKLDVRSGPDDYRRMMQSDRVAGSEGIGFFQFLSTKIAITATSGLWGCFGERGAGILAVIAPDTHEMWDWSRKHGLYSAYSALEELAFAYRSDLIPDDHILEFIHNYRGGACAQDLERLASSMWHMRAELRSEPGEDFSND
ncbi:hypothetical protein GCM10011591_13320 [Nocardia camponoti]|uniref:Uncharacterized protein n=1 Tax=Nocardia camponoti TaxID=1616106 RepID=A0A917V6E7_9NOCA|nr:hypothetical protein GCM10011591_13320 [Nocardia camponoti]